ncbi:hypothetical protein AB0M64_03645 [Streptomyces sp. NPDC051771]|uniref:hypothetical protein n=1 Tax=Streptomyces sp. NPDC051771 TaxID=3154847 RepID=UPI00343775E7
MSVLPVVAPLMVFVSTAWAVLPLLCIRRRRAGLVLSTVHLGMTVVILRPWAAEWYWDEGALLVMVFGQGGLVALGRLAFEASPLGVRRASRSRDRGVPAVRDSSSGAPSQ